MKFLEFFTDAKNRPEIKAVLGILAIVVAFALSIVWLFTQQAREGVVTESLLIFGTFFAAGAGLLGIQAVADAALDKEAK